MPTFTYTARDGSGNAVSGIIEAAEPRGAAASLRDQGLWPLRIDAVAPESMAPRSAVTATAETASFASAPSFTQAPSPTAPYTTDRLGAQSHIDIAPFLVSVPLTDLAAMYEQLGTLLNAGVPIVQALTTLGEQTGNSRLRTILRECALSVSSGNPLSKTMERFPAVFNGLQIELIRAAETSGMMELMCARIALYLHREVEMRRKLLRETLYPKIVLGLAGCVILLLTFLKAGAATTIGRAEMAAGIAVAIFAIWWISRFLNQFPAFGATWDHFKLLIPGPGGVARKYATARFTRALGTLYAGGVLIPNAVAISARACGNRAIGERLLAQVPRLHAGEGISGMLAASGLLSPIAVQMARTGEQTGNLDGMMDKVSDYLESEADVKAHQLAVVSGVAALVVAAGVVLYIAITFYAGMFSQALNAGGS